MRKLKTLEGISDGKVYDIDDIVKADTCGCKGCYTCCHEVGDLVELTPFDVFEIKQYTNKGLDELLDVKIALQNNNKLKLPYLKMVGENQQCSFLTEEGRCSIHGQRPNICRLFPLGRVYENDDFKYFLQVNTCVMPNLEEVKVSEWIGIANYDQNKKFLLDWYKVLKAFQFKLKFVYDEVELARLNQVFLDVFYNMKSSADEDFYQMFYNILPEAKKELGIL